MRECSPRRDKSTRREFARYMGLGGLALALAWSLGPLVTYAARRGGPEELGPAPRMGVPTRVFAADLALARAGPCAGTDAQSTMAWNHLAGRG